MTLPAKNHDDDDAHGVLPVKMIWVGVDFDTARDFLFCGIKEKKPAEKAGDVLFPIHVNRENLRPRNNHANMHPFQRNTKIPV